MAKRRRKPGRPRTGHDPMVGVRLPAAIIEKVDKMAAKIDADRSMIIRLMVEHVLEHGSPKLQTLRSLLLAGLRGWKGNGRAADQIASAAIENIRAQAAAYLAARRNMAPQTRPHAKPVSRIGSRAAGVAPELASGAPTAGFPRQARRPRR